MVWSPAPPCWPGGIRPAPIWLQGLRHTPCTETESLHPNDLAAPFLPIPFPVRGLRHGTGGASGDFLGRRLCGVGGRGVATPSACHSSRRPTPVAMLLRRPKALPVQALRPFFGVTWPQGH